MTALDIPALQTSPADMAMVLLGTFSHLLDNAAALACLQGVAAHLKPGGLLVVELAHPGAPSLPPPLALLAAGPPAGHNACMPEQQAAAARARAAATGPRSPATCTFPPVPAGDLFDGSLIVNSGGGEMWEVEQRGRKLLVEWGSELDDFDPLSQVGAGELVWVGGVGGVVSGRRWVAVGGGGGVLGGWVVAQPGACGLRCSSRCGGATRS
jgi:hypothetical protein